MYPSPGGFPLAALRISPAAAHIVEAAAAFKNGAAGPAVLDNVRRSFYIGSMGRLQRFY
jgi:hypothetical protein